MINFENYLDNISFGCLLSGMIIYWMSLAYTEFKILNQFATICVAIGNIAMATLLILRWVKEGYFPLSNLYESLLFLGWCLTFVSIIMEQLQKLRIIGGIVTPITTCILAFATLSLPSEMQKPAPLVPALKSNWLMMHVTVMMMSYATLIVGSLLAILFLIITKGRDVDVHQLQLSSFTQKEKVTYQPSSISSNTLNLLSTLDNLSYRTIGLGFPLLTIGIISGAVWANEAWGSYWNWDPKETWALITWLVFASYLHARLNKSWQGKKQAILASLGFVIVWICYLGVNFLGQGLHSYGWIL